MNFVHQQYIDHYNNWLSNLNQNDENTPPDRLSRSTTSTSEAVLSTSKSNSASTTLTSEPEPVPSTSNLPPSTIGLGQKHQLKKINYDEVKVFENDQLILYVKKSLHQRQKRFRLQDSLFLIKVQVKNETQKPLLKDLVKVLEEAFTFILSNIRSFFDPEDHNFAYLTLYQEPMVNGLNTGASIIYNILTFNKFVFTTN